MDLYADYWFELSRSWDPFCDDPEETESQQGLPSFWDHHRALLSILDEGPENDRDSDIREQFVPFSSARGASIMKTVQFHCQRSADQEYSRTDFGALLYRSLRYNLEHSSNNSRKRHVAVLKMLERLAEWGCLLRRKKNTESTPEFLLQTTRLPRGVSYYADKTNLAEKLDLSGSDVYKPLQRILDHAPGYREVVLGDFLDGLATAPLPPHLQDLCEQYLRRVRPELDVDHYPRCLQPRIKPTPHPGRAWPSRFDQST
jgi:hypothetical protein